MMILIVAEAINLIVLIALIILLDSILSLLLISNYLECYEKNIVSNYRFFASMPFVYSNW